jgi:hypothetical protein
MSAALLQRPRHSRDRARDLLKPKSATSVTTMPLMPVRRVVRAACTSAASLLASPESARASTEAIAASTEVTMRSTWAVTALTVVLPSLLERIDSELDINEVFCMQED